jgi:hypothetical protein
METLGIEFNDAAIVGVDEQKTVFCEPGYAVVNSDKHLFGRSALGVRRLQPRDFHSRYWRDLTDSPTERNTPGFSSPADLVQAQLNILWGANKEAYSSVVYAVPPFWSSDQLALLLGISDELNIPVAGIVDCSAAATRQRYDGRELFHLESSLHETVIQHMRQDADIGLGDRFVQDGLGIERLERLCIEYIAQRFIACSRFDPLHDAVTEQAMYDRLEDWLPEIARRGELDLELSSNGYDFQASASLGEIRQVLAHGIEPVLQRLRVLLPVGQPSAIQVHARLAEFPGITELLMQLPDCEVYLLDTGAAARGALHRQQYLNTHDGGFVLVDKLPWDHAAQPYSPQAPVERQKGGVAPTHIVHKGRAWRIGKSPFCIGGELAETDRGVIVGTALSGVSRRHCAVQLEQGRVVLHDYSRFGTSLNGHNLVESAVLQSGDIVSIGNPAETFELIVEVGDDGP